MTTTTIHSESVVILEPKAVEAVALLRRARDLAETVKALESEAKAILNETLPEDSHGVDHQGTVIVSRKSAKNTGVDSKALKAKYPTIYAETYRETNYTKLVLPKA